MKTLSLISLFLLVSCNIMAQDDFANKMNEIKLSGKYFTAHSCGETEENAFETCVRNILFQLTPGKYDKAFVKRRVKFLSKPGSPCRVFVYLEKEVEQPSAPQSVVSKPSMAQPSVQQPIVPKVEEAKVQTAIQTDSPLLSQLVADIKARPTIEKAFNSFRAKKDLGLVGNYGSMKEVANPNAVYIVIYDAGTDELIAILTPATTISGRRNLLTNSPDSYDNYRGNKGFWFTFN